MKITTFSSTESPIWIRWMALKRRCLMIRKWGYGGSCGTLEQMKVYYKYMKKDGRENRCKHTKMKWNVRRDTEERKKTLLNGQPAGRGGGGGGRQLLVVHTHGNGRRQRKLETVKLEEGLAQQNMEKKKLTLKLVGGGWKTVVHQTVKTPEFLSYMYFLWAFALHDNTPSPNFSQGETWTLDLATFKTFFFIKKNYLWDDSNVVCKLCSGLRSGCFQNKSIRVTACFRNLIKFLPGKTIFHRGFYNRHGGAFRSKGVHLISWSCFHIFYDTDLQILHPSGYHA